jgi:hypothetical protein
MKIAMRSPSPPTFPVSGPPEEFQGRNFYVVYVNDGTFTYYVDAAEDEDVVAKYREHDKAPLQEARFTYSKLSQLEVRYNHYFNELTLSGNSTVWFLAKHFLGVNYLTLLHRRVVRYFRSLRTVNRDRRIDLLSQVAEMSLSQRNFRFEPISLITQRHGGYYWAEFRNRDETIAYYKVMLDSWVDTGELSRDQNFSFVVNPKAFATLAEHEIQDQRHQGLLRAQRSVVWLTLALVFVGVLQIQELRAFVIRFGIEAWARLVP